MFKIKINKKIAIILGVVFLVMAGILIYFIIQNYLGNSFAESELGRLFPIQKEAVSTVSLENVKVGTEALDFSVSPINPLAIDGLNMKIDISSELVKNIVTDTDVLYSSDIKLKVPTVSLIAPAPNVSAGQGAPAAQDCSFFESVADCAMVSAQYVDVCTLCKGQ